MNQGLSISIDYLCVNPQHILKEDQWFKFIEPCCEKTCFSHNANQRTSGPVNAYLISGPTISTTTSFPKFDIVLKWVKVNSGSSFIKKKLCRA